MNFRPVERARQERSALESLAKPRLRVTEAHLGPAMLTEQGKHLVSPGDQPGPQRVRAGERCTSALLHPPAR